LITPKGDKATFDPQKALPLATPRWELRRGSYWPEFKAFCHPIMFGPIILFALWGTLLSPTVSWLKFFLEALFLVSGVVFAAYRLNALKDGGFKVIPRSHMMWTGVAGLAGVLAIAGVGVVLFGPWVLIFLVLAFFAIVIYNLVRHPIIHNSFTYGMVWGGFPVVLSYIYQAEAWPTLGVIALGAAAGIFGRAYTWNWGLTTCGVHEVCLREKWDQSFPGQPRRADPTCHSNSITCGMRLVMPRPITKHARLRLKMDLAMVLFITIGLALA